MLRRQNILIVTPGTHGGSWSFTNIFLKVLAKRINPSLIYLVSGKINRKPYFNNKIKIYSLRYNFFNLFVSSIPDKLKSLIYGLPTSLLSIVLLCIYYPKIVVINGVLPAIFVLFFKYILRLKIKLVISYNSAVHLSLSRPLAKVISSLFNNVDLLLVNSEGVKGELIDKINLSPKKVFAIEHVADEIFFLEGTSHLDAKRELGINKQKFVFSFVGHLTYEKLFDVYLKIIRCLLSQSKDFSFIIVGKGPLSNYVISLKSQYPKDIIYLGYIAEKNLLKKIYTATDLLWAYSDETYVAKPGIEALSCGTPIIVPDIPAVLSKRLKKVKIKTLPQLESGVAFLLNIDNLNSACKYIQHLKTNLYTENKNIRKRCKEYAQRKHHISALNKRLEKIIEIFFK